MAEYIQQYWQQLIHIGKKKVVTEFKFKNTKFVYLTHIHKVELRKTFQLGFEPFELL